MHCHRRVLKKQNNPNFAVIMYQLIPFQSLAVSIEVSAWVFSAFFAYYQTYVTTWNWKTPRTWFPLNEWNTALYEEKAISIYHSRKTKSLYILFSILWFNKLIIDTKTGAGTFRTVQKEVKLLYKSIYRIIAR